MGEIAEMMLDGTMCQGCGEWLHDGEDGPGFPGFCSACQPSAAEPRKPTTGGKPISCPNCKRRFGTEAAFNQHHKAKHVERKQLP